MIHKRTIFIICGLVVILSAILVYQDYSKVIWLDIPLRHPLDHFAHFLTNLCGVIFFFILWKKLKFSSNFSFVSSIMIMIIASLAKELFIDPKLSALDMISNILGMISALYAIYSANNKREPKHKII